MAVNYEQFKKYEVPCLYIICNKCKLTTQDPNNKCKDINQNSKAPCKMSACKNKDQHSYKVRVKLDNGKEKQRSLNGDFFDVAKDADKFRELVKQNNEQVFIPKGEKPSLWEGVEYFLSTKNGVGVVDYKQKDKSRSYLDELVRYTTTFLKALNENGFHTSFMALDSVQEKHVDIFIKELQRANGNKGYEASYFNKHLAAVKEMLDKSCKYYKLFLDVDFLFDGAFRYVGEKEKKSLTMYEFNSIIAVVSKEQGKYRKGTKQEQWNHYQEWLIEAFHLSLFTGRRREEIINLKWKNVEKIKGVYFIKGVNLKVSRLKKGESEVRQHWVAPVFPQLMDYLVSLGLEENIGKDEYILKIWNRNSTKLTYVCNLLSKSFSHYSKVAGFDFQWYDLKNTYITNVTMVAGNNANIVTDHASMTTLAKHYLNPNGIHADVAKRLVFE